MGKGAFLRRAHWARVGTRSLSSGRPKAGPVGFAHPRRDSATCDSARSKSALALHDVEHEAQIVLLGAAGGRGTADVVEDLAIL